MQLVGKCCTNYFECPFRKLHNIHVRNCNTIWSSQLWQVGKKPIEWIALQITFKTSNIMMTKPCWWSFKNYKPSMEKKKKVWKGQTNN
jgi:hypothetical protein